MGKASPWSHPEETQKGEGPALYAQAQSATTLYFILQFCACFKEKA